MLRTSVNDDTHHQATRFRQLMADLTDGMGSGGSTRLIGWDLLEILDEQDLVLTNIRHCGDHPLAIEETPRLIALLEQILAALTDTPTLVEVIFRRGWDARGVAEGLDPLPAPGDDVPAEVTYAVDASHPVDVVVVVDGRPWFLGGVQPGADPAQVWASARAAAN